MREAAPNPHDAQIRMCWKICRYGIEMVRANDEARRRVLDWIARMEPAFPRSPWLGRWRAIVEGSSEASDLDRPDFFELPEDRRAFWRPLIQSHPFACIFPGRTTRERRAFLSRLP
jgi:hypothetical protein